MSSVHKAALLRITSGLAGLGGASFQASLATPARLPRAARLPERRGSLQGRHQGRDSAVLGGTGDSEEPSSPLPLLSFGWVGGSGFHPGMPCGGSVAILQFGSWEAPASYPLQTLRVIWANLPRRELCSAVPFFSRRGSSGGGKLLSVLL